MLTSDNRAVSLGVFDNRYIIKKILNNLKIKLKNMITVTKVNNRMLMPVNEMIYY